MPAKQLLFRSDARAKLLHGASALADAVRITLGPRSKPVLIAKKWGPPVVCNDGVTISRELELKDLEEDLGVRMIREAAERTGDAVGDGTSTSTLLAHAIYAEGVRNVEAGATAVDLKRGLDRGLHAAVASIQRISRPVASKREKAQIATVSAHNDEQILVRALEAPTRTIADNSGYDDGVVVERMRTGTGNQGFDAARGVYCDLVEAGIIDPTKVVRMALENAVSVAGVPLLSEATMTEPPEPAKHEREGVEP